MEIEVDRHTITVFEQLKNKLLLTRNNRLIVITDFTIETREKKKRFSSKIVKSHYLTSMKIKSYDENLDMIGVYGEDTIEKLVTFFDFIEMRKNYTSLKSQLKGFGADIVPIKNETIDNPQTVNP